MKRYLLVIFRIIREIIYFFINLKWKFLGAKIGKGTKIHVSVCLGMPQNLQIGENTIINIGCIVSSFESVIIGDNVYIALYCSIFDSDHKMPLKNGGSICRKIKIGSGSWLGCHSIILKGVKIGKNVTIGAGSIVTQSIPDNSIAVGSPARVIGENKQR